MESPTVRLGTNQPRGVVTGITGSGQNAVLTVKLAVSGNSITTAAGNVSSAAEVS